MCGIGGLRRFGDEPITRAEIKQLGCALEWRGNHATGICVQDASGELHVLKGDIPAHQFMASKDLETWFEKHLHEDTLAVLLHTRYATKGKPQENTNNHPVCAGNVAIVHNGMIYNDDILFKELKLERKAEVDSDIIRAILDDTGVTRDAIGKLRRLGGSAAIAALDPQRPGWLLLGRSGSPLVLASTPGKLYWASTKDALHMAVRPVFERFGVLWRENRAGNEVGFITMNDDSAWLFGPNGLDWHDKFTTCHHYATPTYRMAENWRPSRAKFGYPNVASIDCLICANPECRRLNWVPDACKDMALEKLRCRFCRTPFGTAAA
jgi:asparagine synthetase B (glutamine-hydrolysing)